ncbi:MAG: flagellar basal body rod protein FlgC [Candidatus Cloacimonadota bacterium]|nr:MAG: flagellar basal body rod protein FlgC [Candidatus Cloacimonadota bacterium]PIE77693.1 MAG: flagellar basal body rod protein FlgC [Candidatus Delongbacteria bacterium]
MNFKRNFFNSIEISATGLHAQRKRMDAIASNIANVNTTRTEEGTPYKRQVTVFTENVKVNRFSDLLEDERTQLKTTDPNHLKVEEHIIWNDTLSGVRGENVEVENPYKSIYDPSHPDADENGYVLVPDINIVSEMSDMIAASRAYEANTTAINAAKGMAKNALLI